MGRTTSNLSLYYESLPGAARAIIPQFTKSPMTNSLFRNKQGFILNSKVVKFNVDSWKYNPQLFCKEYYSDQYFYPIILMVNNLGSIYQFNKEILIDGIIAPDKDVIMRILSQIKTIEEYI